VGAKDRAWGSSGRPAMSGSRGSHPQRVMAALAVAAFAVDPEGGGGRGSGGRRQWV
jgi:hypothetical protein